MAQCIPDNPVYNIGQFGHCKLVTTPVIADTTGRHRVEWIYKGGLFTMYVDAVAEIPLSFNACAFNEQSANTLTFYDPSDSLVTQTLTGSDGIEIEFSKFKLTIMPGFRVVVDTEEATGGQEENTVVVVGNAAYSSDTDAGTAGVLVGEYYEVGPAHDEGAIEGTVKRRIV